MKMQGEANRQDSTSEAKVALGISQGTAIFSGNVVRILSSIASFFTRKKVPATDWLDTPEGKDFEDRTGRVYDRLDQFKINAEKRYFEVGKGQSMLLDQVINIVADDLNEDVCVVREHVLMWMTEASNSADPEYEGTQEYVDLVQAWAEEECEKHKIDLRF